MGRCECGEVFAIRDALLEVVALLFGGDKDVSCAGAGHGYSLLKAGLMGKENESLASLLG